MAADVVIAGTDVPDEGTYRCTTCSYRLRVRGTQVMPPCPSCSSGQWARDEDNAAPPGPEAADGGRTEP